MTAPPADGSVIKPDGYAYRYPDGYIRHSNGREINGSLPSETLPWVYVETVSAALSALRARVTELEANDARYRWLRAENAKQGEAYGTGRACVDLYMDNDEWAVPGTPEETEFEVYGMEPSKLDVAIDRAIDAARSAP